MSAERTPLRLAVIGLVILSLFGVLFARLWFLQVLAGDQFAAQATRNHVRLVSMPAPRGRILDRNGVVLVQNRTSLSVGIRREFLPEDDGEARALKERLGGLLGMSVAQIDRRLADRRPSPFTPVIVRNDVPQDVIMQLRERQTEFPGVETVMLPVRTYPRGSIAAHALGYVGEVNEAELKANPDRYRLGDTIGRTGVERTYDADLRGVNGLQKLEVDASGRVIRVLGDERPIPGDDIQLSIDFEAQRVAEQSLADALAAARGRVHEETKRRFPAPAGAAVVLEPQTGEIVAMASYPTFDLEEFVGGVSQKYFDSLFDPPSKWPRHRSGKNKGKPVLDGNGQPLRSCEFVVHCPLLNRAVQSAYPPGSTFKPIVALAALGEGIATTNGGYRCTSDFEYGDPPTVFKNWRPENRTMSLADSLVDSCDTVYYRFAQTWFDGNPRHEVMQEWARGFGLGERTGIDLQGEVAGRVPDRAWRRQVWEANRKEYCDTFKRTQDKIFEDLCFRGFQWRGGDSVNMSIGQGDVQATPLQMAVAYAAILNGGKVVTPHLGVKVIGQDGKVKRSIAPSARPGAEADPAHLSYIRSALRQTTTRGTAKGVYAGWPHEDLPVGGKTGTSENIGVEPNSWFATYGAGPRPEYVAVAVAERAGFGSQVAGPVLRRVMDRLHDRPLTPIFIGARNN